jgi:putative cell wall-binding protein
VTTVRRRGLAVVLAASFIATTLVTAAPAVAQTDALAASSASDDSRSPDLSTEGLTAAAAGLVSGRLLFSTDLNPGGEPVVDGVVTAYRFDAVNNRYIAVDETRSFDTDGDWSISGLLAGSYRFSFMQEEEPFSSRIWHDTVKDADFSTTVTLTDGVALNFGTVVVPERFIGYLRVAGADRFATSVALSQTQFATGADVPVVIVNGRDYPDALSAGPLANVLGGAMLMVNPTGIPFATAAELARLDPTVIIIVGGTGVVSPAVAQQLESFVTNPSNVLRIAGANRYATSRAVLEVGFDGFVPTEILLATGRNFPDALAASAAAGHIQGAVLLVDGSASTLDAPTSALLDSYGSAVSVIGGTGSVSNGIQQAVANLGLGGQRVSGADRSATSVAIALQFFGYADEAYLVNGSGFADALAASPIAGMRGAPVYLTGSSCLNNAVWNDLNLLGANFVTIVGGTGALSSTVYTLTNCSGASLPGGFAGEASTPVASTD